MRLVPFQAVAQHLDLTLKCFGSVLRFNALRRGDDLAVGGEQQPGVFLQPIDAAITACLVAGRRGP